MTAPAADPMCLCGDTKTRHRLGRKGCKADDCGCGQFETADDAAEKTRVLEVVATVCEDQAYRARAELGQESTSARLRAVEAERDKAIRERDSLARRLTVRFDEKTKAEEATAAMTRGRDEAVERALDLAARIADLEQLLTDAALKLVQQQREADAELTRLRALLEQASAEPAQASDPAGPPLRIDPPVELSGWDAWQCSTCGSRYRNGDPDHPHPLTPVRISITQRTEHHPS